MSEGKEVRAEEGTPCPSPHRAGPAERLLRPGGFDAWVHFSAIEMDGFRFLDAGDPVEFDYKPARQDGFRFVATRVRKH